jgi:UDP:flavonoid glycosyltransferase YjiC (YdhE family)
MTWARGGNLPPMLAVASMLARRGHEVRVLASGETRGAAQRLGFEVSGYRRSPDPDVRVAFEAQADLMMATMAGAEIALDARDLLDELRPDVADGQAALIDRVCEAAAGLDLDAVLTLGPAVDRDAVRVPDKVEVVGFADHDSLMPDAAAVIGHGGLGTVLRALAHGVPQLLLPLGRDQAFNAGRVE